MRTVPNTTLTLLGLALAGSAAASEGEASSEAIQASRAPNSGSAGILYVDDTVFDAISYWSVNEEEGDLETYLVENVEDVDEVEAFLTAYLGRAPMDVEGEGALSLSSGGSYLKTSATTDDGYTVTTQPCNCNVIAPSTAQLGSTFVDQGTEPWQEQGLGNGTAWTDVPLHKNYRGNQRKVQADGVGIRVGKWASAAGWSQELLVNSTRLTKQRNHLAFLQLCLTENGLERSTICNCDKELDVVGAFDVQLEFDGDLTEKAGMWAPDQEYLGAVYLALGIISYEEPATDPLTGTQSLLMSLPENEMEWIQVTATWGQHVTLGSPVDFFGILGTGLGEIFSDGGITWADAPAAGNLVGELLDAAIDYRNITVLDSDARTIHESFPIDRTLSLRANIPRHVLYVLNYEDDLTVRSGGSKFNYAGAAAHMENATQLAVTHIIDSQSDGFVDGVGSELGVNGEGACCNEAVGHWLISDGFVNDFRQVGGGHPEDDVKALLNGSTNVFGQNNQYAWDIATHLDPAYHTWYGPAAELLGGQVGDLLVPTGVLVTDGECSCAVDGAPRDVDLQLSGACLEDNDQLDLTQLNFAAFDQVGGLEQRWFYGGTQLNSGNIATVSVTDPGIYQVNWRDPANPDCQAYALIEVPACTYSDWGDLHYPASELDDFGWVDIGEEGDTTEQSREAMTCETEG